MLVLKSKHFCDIKISHGRLIWFLSLSPCYWLRPVNDCDSRVRSVGKLCLCRQLINNIDMLFLYNFYGPLRVFELISISIWSKQGVYCNLEGEHWYWHTPCLCVPVVALRVKKDHHVQTRNKGESRSNCTVKQRFVVSSILLPCSKLICAQV